ncbi:hypothetical protein ANO11243_002830 [Dothideomycetidae sp. 11243]|nr:hypothetical protein ANO11243_002830 [fungal sp. No.11243]
MAAATNGAKAAPPQNTLYCSNLPDKLQKDDLKRALYMLFTTYGPVLDVVALKTPKMRGQAHVLFRDRDASTQAMRALQDFDFFGKPMKIQYAKTKSDTLAKLDGTYKQPQPQSQAQVHLCLRAQHRSSRRHRLQMVPQVGRRKRPPSKYPLWRAGRKAKQHPEARNPKSREEMAKTKMMLPWI